MSSGDLVTRLYGGFKGVDFRGEEIGLNRSPDSVNMWKDYAETESIQTRPSLELFRSFNEPVYGIFLYKKRDRKIFLIHCGVDLYKIENGAQEKIHSGLKPAKSQAFIFEEKWFFKDGINYLEYDGKEIHEVIGYIPTTSISRKPNGGGSILEDVNLLSPYRINTFVGDGKSKEFFLDAKNIDSDYALEVRVDDKLITLFEINPAEGKVILQDAPPAPLTDGRDNVSIKYKKTIPGHRERITKCNLLQVFDNRVFFAGNENYPNVLFHSSLNNPHYCSDLDYYNEGMGIAPICSLVAGNNALWVFKEPAQGDTTAFYHTPVVDAVYGKIYPSTHSNIAIGCIGSGINFNDDIVFFSQRGMEGVHGDVTTEQSVAHRSSMVDGKILKEPEYRKMILEELDGYLIVCVGSKIYLADSRGIFQNINHYEYEWFYWEFEENIISAKVIDGTLYIGTEKGIYTLTGKGNVKSHWVTPIDRFNNQQYLKTTNKKGCIVEAKGDIQLQVKTNKTGWEEIGSFENVTDFFVARIKRKKFKDLQLKFSSEKRFRIETATIECYVGGYIKR